MELSEVIERVIPLARRIREYYDAELPKYHPNYPLITLEEPNPPPPLEELELQKLLTSLSDDLIIQLSLITYLGRGDLGIGELASFHEELRTYFDSPEREISQIMRQVPLADYLTDAIEELGKHQININRLPLKKTRVRKR